MREPHENARTRNAPDGPEHHATGAALPAESRVDGPHAVRRAGARRAAGVVAASEPQPLATQHESPQVAHAADLAHRLQLEQESVDRRAAELEAQRVELEARVEAARLWFEEQQRELDERGAAPASVVADAAALRTAQEEAARLREQLATHAAEAERRARELDAREAETHRLIDRLATDRAKLGERVEQLDRKQRELEAREAGLQERLERAATQAREMGERAAAAGATTAESQRERAELDELAADLAEREKLFACRRQELDSAMARLHKLGVSEERMAELERAADELGARTRRLEEAEGLVNQQARELADDRRRLADERRKAHDVLLAERRQLEAARAEGQRLADRRAKDLEERAARLDEREQALERVQAELSTAQREVLEMRLATEETWAQLTGALAPATLTRSIALVRKRLADEYARSIEEMAERREELRQVALAMAGEQARLEACREELQAWTARRDAELEAHASRLVAREHELDRQQEQYERLEAKARLERDELREQVRGLMAELRLNTVARAA